MPDSDALIRLRKRLQSGLDATAILRTRPWVDPRPMRDALRRVESSLDAVEAVPEEQSLRGAVLSFLRTPAGVGFRDLKYACFGVTLSLGEGRTRLVDRPEPFRQLLSAVDAQQAESRRFRRCYQALLQSYFAFPQVDEQPPDASKDVGFQTLRTFLTDRLELVARPIGGRTPGWAVMLKEHANLLSDRPCDRYTEQLAAGKTDELAQVCAGLGISRQSWVWQEVVLAYLRQICDRPDNAFKRAIDMALDLAEGKSEIELSAATSRTVSSRLVRRYSDCSERPELPRLRDACVLHIGNPWIRRSAWDAWVRHEPARQLVDGWLKSKIMEDFFTLLSEQTGEATDKRRLKYWLKYVPVITDMWFALGSAARSNRSPEFKAVLSRMAGRRPDLEPSQGEGNNAFIMKIGHYYFIEFGTKGNACYYYREDELPFDLNSQRLSIHKLKSRKIRSKAHLPTGSWEVEFDNKFRPLMGENLPPKAAQPSRWGVPIPNKPPEPPREAPPKATGAATGAGVVWPSYTPPRRDVPGRDDSQASDGDLDGVLADCLRLGVAFRDLRQRYGSVWVHRDANRATELRSRMLRVGFRELARPDRAGHWFGPDVALPPVASNSSPRPPAKPDERRIQSLLAKCLRKGVRYEDLRVREGGGNLWVYTDMGTHPELVAELTALGFRPSRRGFWLEGEVK
jgi:hypothetical protein